MALKKPQQKWYIKKKSTLTNMFQEFGISETGIIVDWSCGLRNVQKALTIDLSMVEKRYDGSLSKKKILNRGE